MRLTKEQIGTIRAGLESGMSPKEISELMQLNYKTVYSWVTKIKAEDEDARGGAPDMTRCRRCEYSGQLGGPLVVCDYLLITGHRRGCPAGRKCTRFKKRTGRRKRVDLTDFGSASS